MSRLSAKVTFALAAAAFLAAFHFGARRDAAVQPAAALAAVRPAATQPAAAPRLVLSPVARLPAMRRAAPHRRPSAPGAAAQTTPRASSYVGQGSR